MVDLSAPTLRPLESQSIFTLLGIRFWDPAANRIVRDDLDVTAWPDGRPQQKAQAFLTGSGVYAFRGLPGMRSLEYPIGSATPWDDDVTPTRFIVEALDLQRRFLPLVFAVDVPFRGVFPTGPLGDPELEALPGIWLFSAPTRTADPALALLRTQLVIAETDPPQPAAHAIVELALNEEESWQAVADENGQMALFFPFPEFTSPLDFSSPPVAMPPQSWSFTLRVQYQPAVQNTPDGANAPDITTLFTQNPAEIWLEQSGPTGEEIPFDFTFGEAPVLRTEGQATLWITPA